jgi:hypothetical protein
VPELLTGKSAVTKKKLIVISRSELGAAFLVVDYIAKPDSVTGRV